MNKNKVFKPTDEIKLRITILPLHQYRKGSSANTSTQQRVELTTKGEWQGNGLALDSRTTAIIYCRRTVIDRAFAN